MRIAAIALPTSTQITFLEKRHQIAYAFLDFLVLLATFLGVQKLVIGLIEPYLDRFESFSIASLVIFAAISIFSLYQHGLYAPKKSSLFSDYSVNIFEALLQTWVLIVLMNYFLGVYTPIVLVFADWVAANLVLIAYRPIVQNTFFYSETKKSPPTHALILGPKMQRSLVEKTIKLHPELHLVSVKPEDWDEMDLTAKKFSKFIEKNTIQLIVTTQESQKIKHLLSEKALTRVKVKDVANVFSAFHQNYYSNTFNHVLFCELGNIEYYSHYETLKRISDLTLATAAVIWCLPIWIVVGVAIKLSSKGPVFFKQERIGKFGKPFTIYKFRSMRLEKCIDAKSPRKGDDPRITKIGRWIRKLSIDETPQFLNVIQGDMSLVGPRPEMPFIVERYSSLHRRRLLAKPGITGLWQIHGRKQPIHSHIKYDLYYVKNASLILDLLIIFRTIPALLSKKGAY